MVVVDFVNAFGFVPLHVLKPAMRINVSINMLFGIAARYSRESAPAMPITSGATRYQFVRIRNAAEKVNAFNRWHSQQSGMELGLRISDWLQRANDLDCWRTSGRRKAFRCACWWKADCVLELEAQTVGKWKLESWW
jgi:hypothetical protein